jgi:hypothetical protein
LDPLLVFKDDLKVTLIYKRVCMYWIN